MRLHRILTLTFGVVMAGFFMIAAVDAGEFRAVPRDSEAGKEIHAVYHKAMSAAKKEDLKGVMDLYSQNYLSDGRDRADMENSWRRIFSNFDNISIEHHIYQVLVSGDRARMICGGAFLGLDKVGSGGLLASGQESSIIDSWASATHDLIKEDGAWKIHGNQVPYPTGHRGGPLF